MNKINATLSGGGGNKQNKNNNKENQPHRAKEDELRRNVWLPKAS